VVRKVASRPGVDARGALEKDIHDAINAGQTNDEKLKNKEKKNNELLIYCKYLKSRYPRICVFSYSVCYMSSGSQYHVCSVTFLTAKLS
jgi:hypothetical protein